MPIKEETLNNQLEDQLSRYHPIPMTSGGDEVSVADEADLFKFNFVCIVLWTIIEYFCSYFLCESMYFL